MVCSCDDHASWLQPSCNPVATTCNLLATIYNLVSAGDQDWAEKEHVPIYIGAPSGNVLKYTPNGKPFDGQVTIIGKIK